MKRISVLFVVFTWEIAFLEVKSEHSFPECSNVKIDSEFPNITVSDYQIPGDLSNARESFFNDTFILLPNTLNFLQFKCTAPYPVQWGFHKYPYISWDSDTRREVKINATSNETQNVFESSLTFSILRESVLENKYPTCYRSSDKCLQTSLNATSRDSVQIRIQKGTDLDLNPEGKYGENQDCALILNYDFVSEKFYCQSLNGMRPSVFVASCSDPVTCASLATKTNCSNTPKIQLSECNEKTNCRSAFLRVDYLPAVAVCMIPGMNSYSATMEYFYSLPLNKTNGRKHRDFRYFNWNNVSTQNMLDISNLINETHFAGEKFNIYCIASYYYFSSGLKFKIRDESNGIVIRDLAAVEKVGKIPSTKIGTTVILPLNRSLTLQEYSFSQPGEYEITCSAPVRNSTEWVSKSTRVTILESQKPIFFDGNGNMTETLYYKPRKEIFCAAFGIPKPSITWSLDGNPLPPTISQVYGVQNETESWRNLLFPNSPSGIYGNFTCRIENVAGYDEKIFILLPNDPSSSTAMIVVAVIGVLALVIVPLVICLWWRVRRSTRATWTQKDVDAFFAGQDVNPLTCDTKTYAYNLPYNRSFEIPRKNIVIDFDTILGEGAYGIVYSAEMVDNSTNPPKVVKKLAMKTLKPIFSVDIFFKALLCELKILSFIGKHNNIVNLEGAVTDKLIKGEILIALEFCENSSLREYIIGNRHTYYNPMVVADVQETSFINAQYVHVEDLTNIPLNTNNNESSHEPLTFKNLLIWAHQIANGMEFLSSKKVIHGDLAARNVLLDANLQAKISDFGLSKRLSYYSTYKQSTTNPLPIQWMAIECLRDLECSIESDIWSYGVTLWEIFSLGNTPYSGVDMSQMEFLEAICKGMRLSRPIHATPQIFDVMMSCWRHDRKLRPGFTMLSSYFRQCAELPMEYVHPTLLQRFSNEET